MHTSVSSSQDTHVGRQRTASKNLMVHTEEWQDWEINHCQLPEGTKWHIQNQHRHGHPTSRSPGDLRRTCWLAPFPSASCKTQTTHPCLWTWACGCESVKASDKNQFWFKIKSLSLHKGNPQGFTLQFVTSPFPHCSATSHEPTSTPSALTWADMWESEWTRGKERDRSGQRPLPLVSSSVTTETSSWAARGCPLMNVEAVTSRRCSSLPLCCLLPCASTNTSGTGQLTYLGSGPAENGSHCTAGWAPGHSYKTQKLCLQWSSWNHRIRGGLRKD